VLARAIPVWQRIHAEIDRLLPHDNAEHLRRGLRALS
jgi:hypothetical protein